MISILVADDHAVVRRGLQEILNRQLVDVRWGEADSGQQVLESLESGPWDLLILDISMAGQSGLDVLKDVRALRPKLPVLVLSIHPEDQYGKRALKAGASGYMNKEAAPEQLVIAIRKLLDGGVYVSSTLADTLASELSQERGQPGHERLSDREFEVLRRIAAGRTMTQIALELHLSVATVSTYRARILEKMNLSTTAELMLFALRNHLVD